MTIDQLVQFAAEKVGVQLSFDPDDEGWYFYGTSKLFDLSSPDLLLKGLAVYYKEGAPFQISPWGVKLGFQNMTFDTIERIPEKFWECWYELEKGDQ